MKLRSIIFTSGAALAIACLAISCDKQVGKEVALENQDFSDKASFQVYNAITGSTRNYVYVDAVPVTGAALAVGGVFPATPAYASVGNGFRAFLIRDTLLSSTQVPMSFAENLQAGRFYTIFAYDTTTTAKQKIVENNIVIPSDTTARLRFANFAYSPNDIGSFDIYSVKKQAVIFSNVRPTEVTSFIPYTSMLTDTFYVRTNGSSSNIQNVDTTGLPTILTIQATLNPVPKRSYTVIFRGSYRQFNNRTAAGVALPAARQLSVFANY